MSSPARPADVFIIVMDCVRQFGPVKGGAAAAGLGGYEREMAWFPLAASSASWTIPSHASLLSGCHPWQHNAHAKGVIPLSSDIPLLQEALRSAGYRTIALSANSMLNEDSGLLRGFDYVAVAKWWENYARFWPPGLPDIDGTHRASSGESKRENGALSPARSRITRFALEGLHRYPWFMDLGDRVGRGLNPTSSHDSLVSPWIEPTFDQLLGRAEPSQPLCVFINLMDAHEPYLAAPEVTPFSAAWWRVMRPPQRASAFIQGRRSPAPREAAVLLQLYTEAVARTYRRVQSLIEIIQQHGRWEGCLFLLTSDHGQAFLEHGLLFHGYRIDEPVVRVPLGIRFPDSGGKGSEGRGWASTVDLAPTVLQAIQNTGRDAMDGTNLAALLDAERPSPLFTLGDGMMKKSPVASWATQEMRERLDVLSVGAYTGRYKVVVTRPGGDPKAFDVMSDPLERNDVWDSQCEALEDSATAATSALDLVLGQHGRSSLRPSSVTDRLARWGYL